MFEDLKIIHYPDPRLKKVSAPVTEIDDTIRALARRMFELMRAHKGVGLAAPQVGKNVRLFVMNHTGEPDDDRVYVNPVLADPDGEEESEEGCLSLPNIHVSVTRPSRLRIRAIDLDGNAVDQAGEGFITRVWQHEVDHLNGTMLTDRMGPVAKMAHRKVLKELAEKYEAEHPKPAPATRRKRS